ncbi:MAG: hypothetical protein P857_808 [Candidatus Xenolissoclinum pacificiensis L6]|uniref:Methyltransferase type 11 domain-containing protein n=1 Tax=Candidatus Xenolissoclinum pacificiensis L6 TaxID=1401685 RepID=W2V2H0_9RICK|nr:MAG: hypothetical protein P857_808 [Candidatus Xenolissoclinum pacificiensis L6]
MKAVKDRYQYTDDDISVLYHVYKLFLDYIPDDLSPLSILNIGAYGEAFRKAFAGLQPCSLVEVYFLDPESLGVIDKKFDIIVSAFTLEQTNDLAKVLFLSNKLLKKDGIFIGSMCTANNFKEFQETLLHHNCLPEEYMYKLPNIEQILKIIKHLSHSLVNVETIRLYDKTLFDILYKIKRLGLSNFYSGRTRRLQKDLLNKIVKYYDTQYADDGYVFCSLELYIIVFRSTIV